MTDRKYCFGCKPYDKTGDMATLELSMETDTKQFWKCYVCQNIEIIDKKTGEIIRNKTKGGKK